MSIYRTALMIQREFSPQEMCIPLFLFSLSPKSKIKGQEQTRVADFKAVARQGLSFGKRGLTGGFSAVLATLFTTLNMVAPNVVADLLDILIRRLLQRLIKTTSLPF
ncbi:hypothetical protein HPB48_011262 [Haemaphysalis longicornis]|uniref:Uncharacterized protein n=1 Tax=Haemaphysalis longicornis TaxID=44386 RepID=A0A9J6G579_HAELO|nr:hypothetical protein HPB48_011262 [Haemaphysalis longicornis]